MLYLHCGQGFDAIHAEIRSHGPPKLTTILAPIVVLESLHLGTLIPYLNLLQFSLLPDFQGSHLCLLNLFNQGLSVTLLCYFSLN
jgi:hypothetical protein